MVSKKYVAMINRMRILSVYAVSEEAAREKVVEQLARPGRSSILFSWRKAGEVVKVEED